MQAYDKYKDSGIEWLGEIPEHWEVKKLKHFGYIYPGLSGKKGHDFSKHQFPGGKKYIPFTTISNQFQITKSKFPYVRVDEREFQHQVQKNDLLFLMSSETIEDIGKSSVFLLEERPYLNSFCKGFRIELLNLNSIFSNYLLNSRTYRKYFELYGRGFTRINIKQEFISGIPFGLPPLPEQEAIAAFLDDKCRKIDEAVRIKQQQIEKLKELRQITIHIAVTKGIDPEAEMKDSGIDWIGEIPKYWEIVPIRRIIEITDGTHDTPEYVEKSSDSFPLITSKDFMRNCISFDNCKYISRKDHFEIKKRSSVQAHDVLMSMIGGNIGKSVIVKSKRDFSVKNVAIFKCRDNVHLSKLILYYIESGLLEHQIKIKSRGGAQDFLSLSDINNLVFLKFPTSEQQEIVNFLETQTTKIDKAIALKTEQIAKLNEYKQSLINDVVTGKIKVTN